MLDINLADEPGFQKRVSGLGIRSEPDPKPRGKKMGKKKKKKVLSIPVEEYFALFIVIGIGILIWWYLSLKSSVRSDIKEFTPQELPSHFQTG